jgi:glucosamine kinase
MLVVGSDKLLFLGGDGGGTGCRARLTDAAGRRLGEGVAGPANIASDVAGAVQSIRKAAEAAIAAAGVGDGATRQIRAGLGLAGGNSPPDVAALKAQALPFRSVRIASDAEAACLGAHRGGDGGILIVGTGSQGACTVAGRTITVGGWGFALSDGGSGAVLGHSAARRALAAHECIADASALTRDIMARFEESPAVMLAWAQKATPRDWGTLAPLVFQYAAVGDLVANALLATSVDAVCALLDRLLALGAGRIAMMGGLAEPYRPHLPARFDPVLVPPAGDALDGALALAGLVELPL